MPLLTELSKPGLLQYVKEREPQGSGIASNARELYHDGAGELGKLDAWYFTRRDASQYTKDAKIMRRLRRKQALGEIKKEPVTTPAPNEN
jgi:hypothetical protein